MSKVIIYILIVFRVIEQLNTFYDFCFIFNHPSELAATIYIYDSTSEKQLKLIDEKC